MICKNCGMENEEGSRFCIGCGTKLDQAEDVAAATENTVKTGAEDTAKSKTTAESAVETEEAAESAGEEKTEEATESAADAEEATKDVDVDEEENNGASANAANTQSVAAEANAKQEESTLAGTETKTAQTDGTEKKEKKKHGPILIIVCAAVILAVLIPASILVFSKPTINLNDYLIIDTDGYNGYGQVSQARINWSAIENDYGSALSFTRANKSMENYTTPVDELYNAIDIDLDKTVWLSNGDAINYTWIVPEGIMDVVKCNLEYEDGTFVVSNLEEVDLFDAFADIDVEFTGTAPYGKAEISYTGDDGVSLSSISCDKKDDLSNGDTVEVTIDIDELSFVKANGKLPKELAKTYTVSGLDEYVTDFSDLPDGIVEKLKKDAEDRIVASVASMSSLGYSVDNLEYAGYVLINAKKTTNANMRNGLYVIYKGDIIRTKDTFYTQKWYFPVKYVNILKDGEGNFSWSENISVVGADYVGGYYSALGYINPVSCYANLVGKNQDSYDVMCGDGFEIFSDYKAIETLADIADEYKQTLADDAKNRIDNYVSDNSDYGRIFTLGELNLAGEYLLIAKAQGSDFEDNNKYVVVYSATVTSPEDEFDPTTVYFPVEYDGIVNLPNGESMVTEYKDIVGRSFGPNSYGYTYGYFDGEEMFQNVVSKNRGNYTYEVSDGLKQFGE